MKPVQKPIAVGGGGGGGGNRFGGGGGGGRPGGGGGADGRGWRRRRRRTPRASLVIFFRANRNGTKTQSGFGLFVFGAGRFSSAAEVKVIAWAPEKRLTQ